MPDGRPEGGSIRITAHVLAEPVRQFVFGQFTGGEGLNNPDCLKSRERQLQSIEHRERARNYPRRTFVSISERMVACKAERISGR